MALAAVATKQAMTLHSAQIAIVKKQHEMEMSLINMLTAAVENAPRPDGTGAVVNKTA